MVKCYFCGCEESPMRGVHLITNLGAIEYYCSSKCRKNALKLKRDKRKLKWTVAYRETKSRIAASHAHIAAAKAAEEASARSVKKGKDAQK